MKKKTNIVAQSDKAETSNVELFITQTNNQKVYRDHKICDHHTHGRANKFPFGSSNGPIFF